MSEPAQAEDATAEKASPPLWKAVLKRVLQAAVVGVAAYYVGRALWQNWSQLRALREEFDPLVCVLSLPFGFAYVTGRGLLWHSIIGRVSGKGERRLDVSVWLASTLGKYVPGKAFMLLGRVFVYRARGVGAGTVALGFLYEMAVLFATAFLFVAVLLRVPVDPRFQYLKPLAALGLLAFFVGSQPAVIRFAMGWLKPLRKLGERLSAVRVWDPARWLAMMVGNWCVLGAGFYVLGRAFIGVPLSDAPHMVASFALAGIAGIAVLVAPSGLGVREGVLVLMLGPVLGDGPAAALAVAARLWMTIAEVAGALFALPYVRSVGAGRFRADEEPPAGDRQ